ncbi:hypothetical protein [Rhodococcoides fascians]|uniref:hypothetical protein n=1 Tax=Rhodococcoides fascians TaxID=1828 RepID=UPI00050C969E|nr:hypothetical protein [Rhodococcus fascians]
MLLLPDLFHWSPTSRRKGIIRSGLLPEAKNSDGGEYGGITDGRPMNCMSGDPATAWRYLPHTKEQIAEHASWDLWQVHLAESDEVHVLPVWGRHLHEIRVANRIPKSRLTLLATRVLE